MLNWITWFYNIDIFKFGKSGCRHIRNILVLGNGAGDCKKSSRSPEAPQRDVSLRRGQLHPKHFACLACQNVE